MTQYIFLNMEQAEKFMDKIESFPEILQKVGERKLSQLANYIRFHAVRHAPKWSGELAGNIHTKRVKKNVFEVRSGASYAAEQEYGIEKGYLPKIRVVNKRMAQWATDKYKYVAPSPWVIQKYTPHMRPAIKSSKKYISYIARSIVLESLRKAGIGLK